MAFARKSNMALAALDGAARDAFDRLYRQYRDHVRRYVQQRFGAGPPDPEDVTQAVFARFAQLEQPQRIDNPAAFLCRMAHNIVIDDRRRLGRTAAMTDNLALAEEDRHDPSAEEVLSARQELERLNQVLAGLKPQQRVAFLMHRVDGLSYADIARDLGISESGARKLVARAMNECMRALRRLETLS